MKYLLTLLLGMLAGVVLAAAVIWFNPFAGERGAPVTPAGAVTDRWHFDLDAESTPVIAHSGERRLVRRPEAVSELWETPIRGVTSGVIVMRGEDDAIVGVASRVGAWSRDADPLRSGALYDSVWLLSLPGRGLAFVTQREDYWSLLREVAVPSAVRREAWHGSFETTPAAGPASDGAARVHGASGALDGVQGSLVARYVLGDYDPRVGPTSMTAELLVSLAPSEPEAESDPESTGSGAAPVSD